MLYKSKRGSKGTIVAVCVVGAILAALYPIAVYPYFHIEHFRQAQMANRAAASLKREDTQPGNMRIWSDPFAPRDD